MLNYKCKNCGGEMSVDGSGSLYCGYCGSKYAFQDQELAEYRNFRMQMLQYLKSIHDKKASGEGHEDILWGNAETCFLETSDGKDVTIKYLYSHEEEGVTSYLTRNSALFVYGTREKADRVLQGIQRLSFPPADVKGLQECFPRMNGSYDLQGGRVLLVFDRQDNLFPLSMFGSLEAKHVAWIISRMENICCVLQYSEMVHGGINEDSIWINALNHPGVLMGNWQRAREASSLSLGMARNQDLKDLRKTGDRVLGMNRQDAPKELLDFLKGKPAGDAYADFEIWDSVIEKGFGGRHFAKMNTDLA